MILSNRIILDCKKSLAALLKEKAEEIYIRREAVVVEVAGLGLGDYEVYSSEFKALAVFTLIEMPHCCGILISCGSQLYSKVPGVGKALNAFKLQIAKFLGYSLVIRIDKENPKQQKYLQESGWKEIHKFCNKKTKNNLVVSVKDI